MKKYVYSHELKADMEKDGSGDGTNRKPGRIWPYFLVTILVIVGIVFAVLLTFLMPFGQLTGDTAYMEAKEKCVKLFEKRKQEFIQITEDGTASASVEGTEIRNVHSISWHCSGEKTAIEFSVDAQGLTGGQYWGIYFVPDDQPVLINWFSSSIPLQEGPYSNSYYYREAGGSVFYATEKIEDNWYFYYMDYDGSKHGLDWGEA